jgi:hypothetical protein
MTKRAKVVAFRQKRDRSDAPPCHSLVWRSCMRWRLRPRVAILVNPANGPSANVTVRSGEDAGRSIGLRTRVLNASTSQEIDAAFASLAEERAGDILFVAADGFFQSRGEQLVALTARDKIPAAYPDRATVQAGGLMSYGTDGGEMFRHVGVYTGNILKGAKPADLPVQESTKFEFVINRKTAKALGLEIPVVLRVTDKSRTGSGSRQSKQAGTDRPCFDGSIDQNTEVFNLGKPGHNSFRRWAQFFTDALRCLRAMFLERCLRWINLIENEKHRLVHGALEPESELRLQFLYKLSHSNEVFFQFVLATHSGIYFRGDRKLLVD